MRHTKQQMWNMIGGGITDEQFTERLAGFDQSTVEQARTWREANMEFLKNCSPDTIFMSPLTNSGHKVPDITLWCQIEAKLYWGRLEGLHVWWFESEDDAAAFEKTWHTPGVDGPGRAWRRKHGA